MICLCYNKEKGLFVSDDKDVKSDDIIIKSHEKEGFQIVSGKEFELNSHTYSIGVRSNFNYGKASYLIALIEMDHRPIVNFDYGDSINFWGMSQGSLRGFYVDPTTSDKWGKIFHLIMDICQRGRNYYGDLSKYRYFLMQRINDAEMVHSKNVWETTDSTKSIAQDINNFLCWTSFSELVEEYQLINTIQRFPKLFVDFFRKVDTAFLKFGIDSTVPEFKIIRLAVKRLLEEWLGLRQVEKFINKSDIEFLRSHFYWRLLDEDRSNIHQIDDKYYVCTNVAKDNKWELIDNKDNVVCHLPKGYEISKTILPSKDTNPILVICSNGPDSVFSFENGEFIYRFGSCDHYERILGFNHGLSLFEIEGKYGVINTKGEIVVAAEYDYIEDFYPYFRANVKAKKRNGILSEINLSTFVDGIELENEGLNLGSAIATTIKNVSCKNFKRFHQLPPLSLSTINFMVGENNAGKSTFIEVIKLFLDKLFQLVYRKGNPVDELFGVDYDKYVSHTCTDEDADLVLSITFSNNITVRYSLVKDVDNGVIGKKIDIDYIDDSHRETNKNFGMQYALTDGELEVKIKNNVADSENYIKTNTLGKDVLSATEENLNKVLISEKQEISGFIQNVRNACTAALVVNRIPAWLEDNVIDEFTKQYSDSDNEAKEITDDFINKWLAKFDIGSDFGFNEVLDRKSDCKGLFIKDKDCIEKIDAKGTGSRHFTYLLLDVCRTLLKALSTPNVLPIILIEEPEQNLHPKLQSLIADFLWDITRYWKKLLKRKDADLKISGLELHIIVETHSEYLIRRSQRYVKTFCSSFGSIDEIPFRTFYFPKNKDPYDMKYTESGRFTEQFGAGFFDEAARLSFDISSL